MLFEVLTSLMFTLCWLSSTSRRAFKLNFVKLFGETSVWRNFRQQKFRSVKIPFGEISVRRKFSSTKIPPAKYSERHFTRWVQDAF